MNKAFVGNALESAKSIRKYGNQTSLCINKENLNGYIQGGLCHVIAKYMINLHTWNTYCKYFLEYEEIMSDRVCCCFQVFDEYCQLHLFLKFCAIEI